MEDVKIMGHVFLSVLVFGTLWRVLSFHALASPQVHFQHLGKAMSIQY